MRKDHCNITKNARKRMSFERIKRGMFDAQNIQKSRFHEFMKAKITGVQFLSTNIFFINFQVFQLNIRLFYFFARARNFDLICQFS